MLTVLVNTTLSLFILAELLSQRKINPSYLSGDREKLVILTASFIPHLYSMGVLCSPITLMKCRHLSAFVMELEGKLSETPCVDVRSWAKTDLSGDGVE